MYSLEKGVFKMAKLDELMEKMKDEAFAKKFEGCETAEELIMLAKNAGIELTKEEAEDLLDKLDMSDLDMSVLQNVAGGGKHHGMHFR